MIRVDGSPWWEKSLKGYTETRTCRVINAMSLFESNGNHVDKVQIPALPFNSCMSLNKLLKVSAPQFLHLKKEMVSLAGMAQ